MSKTAKNGIKLHPKVKAFADELINNPKINHTEAYIKTHKTNNRNAAKVNASKTLTNPNVQIYLNKHIDKARNRIVQLIDSDKENISLQASESVLDRALGKPVQQTQNINLNIDSALNDIL
jgi:hypothetical protein